MSAVRAQAPSPNLASYDRIIVAFSGGKDSIACLLTLLDAGVSHYRIEVCHHDIDGAGASFMDWPSTPGYCRAICTALGVPFYLSWKEGGFLREMLRNDEPTAPIRFEQPNGVTGSTGGQGPDGTRLRFPQVTANLNQRWCSAYLKIDVMAALIRSQPRFLDRRTLIVTGERAAESAARARYATFEPDRTDTRDGTRRRRHVDHWRPVHRMSETEIWTLLRRHGVVPAPAYRLGWNRLSCLCCIFLGADGWSSVRRIDPERFELIASYEDAFGVTIQRQHGVRALADRGKPYEALLRQPELAARAMQSGWDEPVLISPDRWAMPAGAFGHGTGPS